VVFDSYSPGLPDQKRGKHGTQVEKRDTRYGPNTDRQKKRQQKSEGNMEGKKAKEYFNEGERDQKLRLKIQGKTLGKERKKSLEKKRRAVSKDQVERGDGEGGEEV